ncbi:MAG: LysR family transcriptional regulator [Myxococcota bacterium]
MECFVAVAEELHFRRAADRVGMSQPALSQRIKRLEERLEVTLLERTRRDVALTPAGEVLFDHCRPLLAALDRAVEATRSMNEVTSHRLVFGYIEYMNLSFVPMLVHQLANGNEPVEVVRRDTYTDEVVRGLLDRSIDVGIVVEEPREPDLVPRLLIRGCWSVVVPRAHRFTGAATIDVADLAGERLIFFSRRLNPPLYERLRGAMREGGFEPQIVYETAQASVGPEMVRNQVGLFIAASYVIRDLSDDLVAVPIDGLFAMNIYLAWHMDNRSRALEIFREVLGRHLPRPEARSK